MKQYLLTPKRAAHAYRQAGKRALKEEMAKGRKIGDIEKKYGVDFDVDGDMLLTDYLEKVGYKSLARILRRAETPSELYLDKHTPKEQAVVFRKINQIIKSLKGRAKD